MLRFEFPFTNREPTFGLALGGGAVFGIAHLGALKALEEHGLRPTHLTGTSIGAIMASLYAFGHTPEAIRKQLDAHAPGLLGRIKHRLARVQAGSKGA